MAESATEVSDATDAFEVFGAAILSVGGMDESIGNGG